MILREREFEPAHAPICGVNFREFPRVGSFVLASFPMIGDDELQRTSTKGHVMAQAIMDPEKVRRFADELQRFNTDLENRLVLLQGRFGARGDTWQDHEQRSEEDTS